ncbi:MAG TPA: hypothetical protein VF245_05955 [Solirubrobacterales bacterium]
MGEDRSDPRPMLALFALLVAVSIWRAVSSIRVDQLLASAASLAPFALGALAIATALATQRLLATRRTLATRTAAAIVPADEFDAKPEAVLRVAAELARADRSVRGWFDRRACAMRVRLTNDGEGRLLYLLEVPARSRQLLRNALRGYEGVELRDAAEVASELDRPGGVTLRTELILARPSVEPLARLDNEPDPLQPFAAAMASLRPQDGERSTVCLDLLPAAGRRRTRLRRRLKRQARRAHGERRSLMEVLDGERRRDTADPAELIDRRLVGQALDAKLRDAGPLFEAQVLLCCQAAERPRAKLAMQSLLAAFEPFAAQNWLRPAGLGIGDAVFFGSDFPTRRRGFDRRLSSGLFRPARRSILTAREVAGFLKPPTVHCLGENVLRSGTLLPAPPELPTFEKAKDDLIPLGRIAGEGGERVVGVRAADTFFSYVAGRSRYGKTETAIAQFVHLVRSSHGGLFLDPHADALQRIRPYLDDPDVACRVVEIDLSSARLESLPGWNLFELSGSEPAAAESRVEAIVDAFASTLQWGEQSTRAINLTTQAAGALAAIAPVLPPELAPTIFQLPTLLSNERWRAAALPFLPKASQAFWIDRFPLLAQEAITPLTNLVDRLRHSTPISALLGQSQSTYRVRDAMDNGQIVLACPGSGGTRERLLANLLLFDLLHAARTRSELAPAARRPFWVFLDEVQSYDGAASGNLAALLEQSAKFGLRAVVLNQNPERLNPQTLNALTTNRSHLLATALNSHAAALLTKEWAGQPNPAALTKLGRYRFIAQVTHRGELSKPFALGGIRVEDVLEAPAAHGKASASEAAGRLPAGEVIAHLETLDERILAKLEELKRKPGASERSAPASEDGAARPAPLWAPTGEGGQP